MPKTSNFQSMTWCPWLPMFNCFFAFWSSNVFFVSCVFVSGQLLVLLCCPLMSSLGFPLPVVLSSLTLIKLIRWLELYSDTVCRYTAAVRKMLIWTNCNHSITCRSASTIAKCLRTILGNHSIPVVVSEWVSEQCFTSPPTPYRLYGRRFLQVKRSNQQYQSTEGRSTKDKENNENN